MDRQPLIIGIDLTNEYCQASYFNLHHGRPESVMTGGTVMRYLIPAVLCYDRDNDKWLIGEEAMLYSEQTGLTLYKDLYNNIFVGAECVVDGKRYTYDMLLAVYMGRLLELIQISSGLMSVENITVTMRKVNMEIKEKIEGVFDILKIDSSKIRILSYAESFAYFVLNEDESLWKDGALLFDFDTDGFFVKQMSITGEKKRPLVYINERSYSLEFNIRDLASEMQRIKLDRRLTEVYEEVRFDGKCCSVFFTGTGFSELWFENTLQTISRDFRVFKGNNLYVKGACLAGYILAFKGGRDYPIVCKGRTKAAISVVVTDNGEQSEIVLSKAACDWYDAGSSTDFILTGEKTATFIITSLVSRERTEVRLDLSDFPDRKDKATRVEVSVKYRNDSQCDLTVTDKGFGEFYEATGKSVSKLLDLEGYI